MSLSSDDEGFKSARTVSEQKEAGDSMAAQEMRAHPSYQILVKTISELEAHIRGLASSFTGSDYSAHWQMAQKFLSTSTDKLTALSTVVAALSDIATKSKSACFSEESLNLLRGKAILEGVDVLRKEIKTDVQEYSDSNKNFVSLDLPTVFGRVVDVMDACNFCHWINQSRAPTVVVSIGSAGTMQAGTQECPKFVKDIVDSASQEGRVEVLNIDPAFRTQAAASSANPKISIRAYAGKFPSESLGSMSLVSLQSTIDSAKAVEMALGHILENPDRKVVLLSQISPFLPSVLFEIAKKHQEKLGMQLEIIGNYFISFPAVVYGKGAFQYPDYASFKNAMQPFWDSVFCFEINVSGVQKNYPAESFGKIYAKLEAVSAEVLFQESKPTIATKRRPG